MLAPSVTIPRSEPDPGTKRALADSVSQYKKTLSGIRRDYSEVKSQEEQNSLLEDPALEQRNRLMAANERLERGSDRIKYAMDTVADTESTALEITEELNRNREKIEGISSRVGSVSGLADQARRVIHGMNKRETQQKILLWLVAFIMFGVVGAIIYLVMN